MHEILTRLVPLAVAVFLASAMFSLALDLTVGKVIEPLRNRRLVTVALIANVLIVPLTALALSRAIPMNEALGTGLVLYALCGGTEAGPKLVQMARGNAAFAMGLLAVMILITLGTVPLAISLFLPAAHVERGPLLLKLLVVVALPIGVGLYLRARHDVLATWLSVLMHRVSTTLLLLVFAQLIYVNFDEIASLQLSALAAGLLLFAAGFAAGYALGGPQRANRRALAIMTFARNGSIGMMMAGQVFPQQPKVLVMVTVMTTISVVIGVVAVAVFRHSPVTETTPSAAA